MINLYSQIPKSYRSSPDWVEFLSNIQGNIIKHHGRKHAHFLFIKFHDTRQIPQIKQWIISFSDYITTAYKQLILKKEGHEELLCSLFFSREGVQWLNLRNIKFYQESYGNVLAYTNEQPEDIDIAFRDDTHLMILLAHTLTQEIEEFIRINITDVLNNNGIPFNSHVEKGEIMENGIEPFGFRDGLSQPELRKEKSISGTFWNSAANLSLAFFKFRGIKDFGSYAVYLKIKQDIGVFNDNVELAALKIKDEGLGANEKKELAAAYLMGRFRDGTPIVQSSSPKGGDPTNDFNYKEEGAVHKCPFFAHIFKSNPRSNAARKARIIRRGIPFQTRDGLHFLSYQRDIFKQFITIYKEWIISPLNPASNNRFGRDPIMLDDIADGPGVRTKQIPPVWGQAPPVQNAVGNTLQKPTHVKGVVFLFVPSLYYLKNLAAQ